MSNAGLRSVTRCAEEFVKPVLCYRVNMREETAIADPPVELELDVALESSPPRISIAVRGTAPSLMAFGALSLLFPHFQKSFSSATSAVSTLGFLST